MTLAFLLGFFSCTSGQQPSTAPVPGATAPAPSTSDVDETPPPPLANLSASLGAQSGTIDLLLTLPDDYSDYAQITMRRALGIEAPADCTSGSLVQTVSEFTDSAITINDPIAGFGATWSYRVCIYDAAENITDTTTFTYTAPTATSRVRSVQTGTLTVAPAPTSHNQTITSVDLTKSILLYTEKNNNPGANYGSIGGRLTSDTNIRFDRYQYGGTNNIVEWTVIEFEDGVSVQRGEILSAASTEDVTITQVDLQKSFPLISYVTNDFVATEFDGNDHIRAKFTSETNLQITYTDTSGPGKTYWQVVQFDGALVQSGDFTLGDGVASVTADINEVEASQSVIFFTTELSSDGTLSDMSEDFVNSEISASNQITFTRENAGVEMTGTYYVVSFLNSTQVQSQTVTLSSTETSKDVSINEVDLTRSVLTTGGRFGRLSNSSFSSAGHYAPFHTALTFPDASTVRLERLSHQSTETVVRLNAIEFAD